MANTSRRYFPSGPSQKKFANPCPKMTLLLNFGQKMCGPLINLEISLYLTSFYLLSFLDSMSIWKTCFIHARHSIHFLIPQICLSDECSNKLYYLLLLHSGLPYMERPKFSLAYDQGKAGVPYQICITNGNNSKLLVTLFNLLF